MKKINVILACLCSLFLFTGCYTNEFGEEENTVSKEITEEEAKVLIERIEAFDEDMDRYLEKASSIDEMQQYIDDIANNPNVERAWIENDAVCVKIEDGGIIVYDFNEDNSMAESSQNSLAKKIQMAQSRLHNGNPSPAKHLTTRASEEQCLKPLYGCENRKVLIFNAAPGNFSSEQLKGLYGLCDLFNNWWGVFDAKIVSGSECTVDFITNHFTDYGLILMFAHGAVFNIDNENIHYIITAEKIKIPENYSKDNQQKLRDWVNNKLICFKGYKRLTEDLCWAISEKFIDENLKGEFVENSILLAHSCYNLKYDNKLAMAFQNHGLSAFVGFDNPVRLYYGWPGFYFVIENLFWNHSPYIADEFKEISLSEAVDMVNSECGNFNKYGINPKLKTKMCLISKSDDIALFSTINTQKIVNLGLTSNWAGYNIGASSPEEYGDLTQWGISDFNENIINICGSKYDGTTKAWGKEWRLPNSGDFNVLIDREFCKWDIGYEYKGVKGARVTGPSGESIFLPAAGCLRCGDESTKGKAGFYPSGEATLAKYQLMGLERLMIDMLGFFVEDCKWGMLTYHPGGYFREYVYNNKYTDDDGTEYKFSDYKYTIRAVQDNPDYKKNASLFSEKKDNVQIHNSK